MIHANRSSPKLKHSIKLLPSKINNTENTLEYAVIISSGFFVFPAETNTQAGCWEHTQIRKPSKSPKVPPLRKFSYLKTWQKMLFDAQLHPHCPKEAASKLRGSELLALKALLRSSMCHWCGERMDGVWMGKDLEGSLS